MNMLSIKKWLKEFRADAEKIISIIAAMVLIIIAGKGLLKNKHE